MQTASRYPWGKGTPTWVRDATPDDSDKTFTVPAGKIWDIKEVVASLTASGAAGNRQLTLKVYNNAAAQLNATIWGAVTAANLTTTMDIAWGSGTSGAVSRETCVTGVGINNGFQAVVPSMLLLAGYSIRIYDVSAIAVAGDDLTVVLHYIEYDI